MIHQLTNKFFFCSTCIKCINKHWYSLSTHFLVLFPPSNGPHSHVLFLLTLKCKVSLPVLSVFLSTCLFFYFRFIISYSFPLSSNSQTSHYMSFETSKLYSRWTFCSHSISYTWPLNQSFNLSYYYNNIGPLYILLILCHIECEIN